MNLTKVQAGFLLTLIVVSAGGSGIYWWYMQPKAYSTVSGLVHLDEPIVGASITVYDSYGVKVFEKQNATDTIGSFAVNVIWGIGEWNAGISNDLKIVATGGTVGDGPFNGTIIRIVQNHGDEQFYYLNAITTLIAAYMNRHPEVTYDEASDALKDFLGVPEFVDMELVVDSAAYYRGIFDHAFFMYQAEEHADFDTFIEELLEEFEMGKAQASFGANGEPWTWKGAAIKFVCHTGTAIFDSLLSIGVSQAFGALMRACGFQDTGVKLDKIINMLYEIKEQLNRIEQDLLTIENELKEIKRAIDELGEMEIAKTLVEYVETIETNFQVYSSMAQSGQEQIDNNDLERLRNSILDPNQGVIKAMNVIYDLVKGHEPSFQKPGILEVITNNIISNVIIQIGSYESQIYASPALYTGLQIYIQRHDRTVLDDYLHTVYDNFFDYYLVLENYFAVYISAQMKGLILIEEAYNYHNQTGLAQDYIKMFVPKLEAQMDTFLNCIDTLVFNLHPFPMAEFPNMGTWSSPPYTPDRAAMAQIYQRVDYLVEKVLAAAHDEEKGRFKARVLLSMLEPEFERMVDLEKDYTNIYGEGPDHWYLTSTRSTIGGNPISEFAPAQIAMNEMYSTLAFQYLGDQPQPNIPVLSNSTYPTYKPINYTYRNVTIYANAPSRWALPRAVTDYGSPRLYGVKDMVEVPGQMSNTVPYGKDGTITYVLFDFGRIPAGYYRLLTGQTADQVNQGTGWVMDYERPHAHYVLNDPNWLPDQKDKYWYSYEIRWPHNGDPFTYFKDDPRPKFPDAVIYIGFDQGPSPTREFAVLNPLNYHLHDGYDFSRQGYIYVSNDEDGDPFGYWGGYWRQSDYVETFTRNPTGDTWLNEQYKNENFGGDDKLEVRSHGTNARMILKFDLADLPENIVVESATLVLTCTTAQPPNDPKGRTYICQSLYTTSWVEGTKSGGIQSGSACWWYAQHNTLEWAAPGGDSYIFYTAKATVPADSWWGKHMTWNVTDLMKYKIDHDTDNEAHFIIYDMHEGSSTNYWLRFHSRETIIKNRTPHVTDWSLVPRLSITYKILPTEGTSITEP